MATVHKLVGWFVKPDVPVAADAQQLQVDPARFGNFPVIPRAFALQIGRVPIWDMPAFGRQVNVSKQLLIHKIAVTARVPCGQLAVLIQVEGCRVGKIQHACLIQTDQLPVGRDRRRPRGQTEHTFRFL